MTGKTPPLYALRAFEAAARAGSFTRAAEELAITQSAVSRHIKTLEGAFDCSLFVRNGPKLVLAEQGRILAQELKVGFKIIDSACQLLKEKRYTIRLKAPSTLTVRWLLSRLNEFKAISQHPVQLNSVWMDVDDVDFYSEPYDCAILLGAGRHGEDTEAIKLFDEWLVPVCRQDYLASGAATPSDLNGCEILHPSPDRRDWKRWLARLGLLEQVGIDRGLVFDTLDQGLTAASQGLGISVCDVVLAMDEINAKRLCTPFRTGIATGDAYHLVWLRSNPKSQSIRRFGEYLASRVPPLPDDIDYLC